MRRRNQDQYSGAAKPPLSAHEAGKFSSHIRYIPVAADSDGAYVRTPEEQRLDSLTPTEMEVLALMAERHNNAEIAARREVFPSTIEKHIEHIYEALDVKTRADAVALFLHVQLERSRREGEELRKEIERLVHENAALRLENEQLRAS